LQGVHWPHDSTDRNLATPSATAARSVRSSKTMKAPHPSPVPICCIASWLRGVSSCAAVRSGVKTPPMTAVIVRPGFGPPPITSIISASGVRVTPWRLCRERRGSAQTQRVGTGGSLPSSRSV
jgi:hypothetical protein